MKRVVFLMLALATLPGATYTQSKPQVATVIDGAKHPELIPDSTAYRLYLMTVSNMPADLQVSQLRSAGVSAEKLPEAIAILAYFKSQWDRLRDTYNESTKLNPSDQSKLDKFLELRDALVTSTRRQLEAGPGAEVMSALHSHIQHEKARMKVSAESAGESR